MSEGPSPARTADVMLPEDDTDSSALVYSGSSGAADMPESMRSIGSSKPVG